MKTESIQEIKQYLAALNQRDDENLLRWTLDTRQGVQQALKQWERRIQKQEQALALFEEMQYFEKQAQKKGHQLIAGIDEVGRGPLAGPVVAAAVILPESCQLLGVNDSKKLSAFKREELFHQIQAQALAVGVGIVDHTIIDEINIYQASKVAMENAVNELGIVPDYLLIDAMKLNLPVPQESLIKGDARSISIAAASIVAKVVRDRLMGEYAKVYPGYGFEKNAGYGTKEHLTALDSQGICAIHRKTFAPIKNFC